MERNRPILRLQIIAADSHKSCSTYFGEADDENAPPAALWALYDNLGMNVPAYSESLPCGLWSSPNDMLGDSFYQAASIPALKQSCKCKLPCTLNYKKSGRYVRAGHRESKNTALDGTHSVCCLYRNYYGVSSSLNTTTHRLRIYYLAYTDNGELAMDTMLLSLRPHAGALGQGIQAVSPSPVPPPHAPLRVHAPDAGSVPASPTRAVPFALPYLSFSGRTPGGAYPASSPSNCDSSPSGGTPTSPFRGPACTGYDELALGSITQRESRGHSTPLHSMGISRERDSQSRDCQSRGSAADSTGRKRERGESGGSIAAGNGRRVRSTSGVSDNSPGPGLSPRRTRVCTPCSNCGHTESLLFARAHNVDESEDGEEKEEASMPEYARPHNKNYAASIDTLALPRCGEPIPWIGSSQLPPMQHVHRPFTGPPLPLPLSNHSDPSRALPCQERYEGLFPVMGGENESESRRHNARRRFASLDKLVGFKDVASVLPAYRSHLPLASDPSRHRPHDVVDEHEEEFHDRYIHGRVLRAVSYGGPGSPPRNICPLGAGSTDKDNDLWPGSQACSETVTGSADFDCEESGDLSSGASALSSSQDLSLDRWRGEGQGRAGPARLPVTVVSQLGAQAGSATSGPGSVGYVENEVVDRLSRLLPLSSLYASAIRRSTSGAHIVGAGGGNTISMSVGCEAGVGVAEVEGRVPAAMGPSFFEFSVDQSLDTLLGFPEGPLLQT